MRNVNVEVLSRRQRIVVVVAPLHVVLPLAHVLGAVCIGVDTFAVLESVNPVSLCMFVCVVCETQNVRDGASEHGEQSARERERTERARERP